MNRYTATLNGAKINLKLAPKPEVALTARKALDPLAELLPPDKFDDVRLAVSELVANSILHAGLLPNDRISLSVAVSGESVRGKVCDPGSGFEVPSVTRSRADLSGGWGLPIIESISDRWGVERNSCMCVWFEID
jgi:anti-sigma regulatory factor (Ser/Thr protein kinase)